MIQKYLNSLGKKTKKSQFFIGDSLVHFIRKQIHMRVIYRLSLICIDTLEDILPNLKLPLFGHDIYCLCDIGLYLNLFIIVRSQPISFYMKNSKDIYQRWYNRQKSQLVYGDGTIYAFLACMKNYLLFSTFKSTVV